MISVVGQFLYLLTDLESLLGHTVMMEMDLPPVMSVFMIIMDRLGCKLEQILMGKRQMTVVVGQFLYLLTDQG